MSGSDIARREETSLARLDAQALISQAIDKGADIGTLERLVSLAKDVSAEIARAAYQDAVARFQKDCPAIRKTSEATIATRSGRDYSYSYAELPKILEITRPVMGALGLSVSWRTLTGAASEVTVICRLSHAGGHFAESGQYTFPIVTSDPTVGANPMQRVGIALTYAKRYSLLGVLGIAPEDNDTDGAITKRPRRSEPAQEPASAAPTSRQNPESPITENQVKRLSAIASGQKWTDKQVTDLLLSYQYASRHAILVRDYDAIVDILKAGPAK